MLDFPASHVWLPEGKQFNKHQQPEKYWGTPCLGLCSIFNGFCLALIRVGKVVYHSGTEKVFTLKNRFWMWTSWYAGCRDVVHYISRKADSLNAASSFWHGSGRERLRGPPAIPWSPSVLRLLRHWNHTGDNPRPMSQWFSRTQSVYIYVDIDNECMLIYNVMSVMLYPI